MNLLSSIALTCQFQFMQMPFVDLQTTIFNETAVEFVEVTRAGQTHKESLTLEPAQAGQYLRFTIAKESSENSLEWIVFPQKDTSVTSVLVNHHVPFGKEVWGTCQIELIPKS